MKRRNTTPEDGQFGPQYNVTGAGLATHRKLARNGLQAMTWEQRQAYGASVERAILDLQRRELLGANAEIEGRSVGDIGAARRAQQSRALLSCPGKVRRARTQHEWETMYREAMPKGFVPSWEREAAAEEAEAQAIAERVMAGGPIFLAEPERVAA
jgi:hypothetical protein